MIWICWLIALPLCMSIVHQGNSSHFPHITLFVWTFALAAVNPYCSPVANRCRTSSTLSKSIFEANSKRLSISSCLNIENDSRSHQIFDYGCVNFPGTDPDRPQKVNQDGSFYMPTRDIGRGKRITLFGIMDGHGLKGHVLVQYLQQQLPPHLIQCLRSALVDPVVTDPDTTIEFCQLPPQVLEQFKQDLVEYGHADPMELYLQTNTTNPLPPKNDVLIRQAIVDAFLSVHYQASKNANVPSSRSGTTCICCILIHENDALHLYTATVGDSRAILLSKSNAGTSPFMIQSLTKETTVKLTSERDRIMSCESRIDASGNVFYGPIGIAMTRSLGNSVMLQAGILPIPVVSMETVSAFGTHYYVCAGTDGIFDVLSNEQVAEIVNESVVVSRENGETQMPRKSLQEIAKDVCNQARQAWLDDLPIEPKVDDITFAIMDVFSPGKTSPD
jgi:serine/threonine protein phosphatase PrpC